MTLEEARSNIGESVVYSVYYLDGAKKSEPGVITSVSEHFVFVRYGNDKHSKATLAQMLTLQGR